MKAKTPNNPPKLPAKKLKKLSNNPNLVENGKATQFQPGNKPKAPEKAWSYRKELQYIACQPIKADPSKIKAEMKRLMKMPDGSETTPPRMLACRIIEKAITQVNPFLIERLIDNTEGKLSQELSIPPFIPAPTSFATLAEAEEAYKNHMKR